MSSLGFGGKETVTMIDIEVYITGQVKTTHSRLWRWDTHGKCDLNRMKKELGV